MISIWYLPSALIMTIAMSISQKSAWLLITSVYEHLVMYVHCTVFCTRNTNPGSQRQFYPLTCWSQCIAMISLLIEKVIIQEVPILQAFITEVAECKNQQNESNNVSQQQEPNRLQQELHWNSWCNQATKAKEAHSTSLIFQFSTHHTYRWAAWDLCYQNHLGESGLNRFVWCSRKCQLCGGNQV